MGKDKIRSNTVYTIIGNALILFVIGLLLLSLFIGQNLISKLEDQFSFQIELQDNLDETDIAQVIGLIKQLEYIDDPTVKFQDRTEVAKSFIDDLDIKEHQDIITESLFDAISFKMKSDNVNSADIIRVKRELSKIPFVSGVNHIEDMSKGLFDNMERIRLGGFLLSVILSLVLVVLIYNNTRLSIYAERFKIRKMQLIGAIPWFITRPFVISAIGIGVSSAIVAILGVLAFAMLASGSLLDSAVGDLLLVIAQIGLILLVISITISVMSSYVIVNRYLRMDVDELYT